MDTAYGLQGIAVADPGGVLWVLKNLPDLKEHQAQLSYVAS